MYGLVNHAIQGLVTAEFGEDKWKEIKRKSGVEDDVFLAMKQYDDAITYKMVEVASEVTGVAGADLLEAFGTYWVLYTAEQGYGEMLDKAGSTFVEFIENLNSLHARVGKIMPGLIPPKFEVKNKENNLLELIYSSKRAGLNPMVVGLIKGLAERFEQKGVEIEELSHVMDKEGYCTTFKITWQ
ncbi:MAG: heme NO-binding domain-containing protein [Flavobacteriales bacterium]|nr:heme NO-binding domain-containing protein [Flavobacteriales bacterium]